MNPETARLFNSAIGAATVTAAADLGLFEALDGRPTLDYEAYCERHRLHPGSVRAILHALACFEIVRLEGQGGRVTPGRLFEAARREKAFFLWMTKGYGAVLRDLSTLARLDERPADPRDSSVGWRDAGAIASAAEEYGARFVDPQFFSVLDGSPFSTVLDLGCGSAGRLISVARARPGVRGLGVDINSSAVELARKEVRAAKLDDRIEILQADVVSLSERPEFRDVDLIMSFFMGHDLWPRHRCLRILTELAQMCPHAGRFLLCDTFRSGAAPSPDLPTFTLGFELTHAVMGQHVPTRPEWLSLFADSPWDCVAEHEIGIPYSVVFDLRRS